MTAIAPLPVLPRRSLLLAALGLSLTLPARAALWGERVEGSRKLIRQDRPLGSFHALALGLPAEVELRQGDSEGITLETDDNILPLVETRIEQGTLQVRALRRGLELSPSALRVVVRFRELDDLAIGGAGTVTGSGLKARRLHLAIGGSGRIVLAQLRAEAVEAAIGGSGNVRLTGSAHRIGVSIGGSGDVLAEGLQADSGEVSIGGSGNVQVFVTERLEVAIAGSGRVRYWGDPQVESAVVGTGRLVRVAARP